MTGVKGGSPGKISGQCTNVKFIIGYRESILRST
jgi:hypothetical protein